MEPCFSDVSEMEGISEGQERSVGKYMSRREKLPWFLRIFPRIRKIHKSGSPSLLFWAKHQHCWSLIFYTHGYAFKLFLSQEVLG